jgi:hypothetical protein
MCIFHFHLYIIHQGLIIHGHRHHLVLIRSLFNILILLKDVHQILQLKKHVIFIFLYLVGRILLILSQQLSMMDLLPQPYYLIKHHNREVLKLDNIHIIVILFNRMLLYLYRLSLSSLLQVSFGLSCSFVSCSYVCFLCSLVASDSDSVLFSSSSSFLCTTSVVLL